MQCLLLYLQTGFIHLLLMNILCREQHLMSHIRTVFAGVQGKARENTQDQGGVEKGATGQVPATANA